MSCLDEAEMWARRRDWMGVVGGREEEEEEEEEERWR